jgi:hypothetical protein
MHLTIKNKMHENLACKTECRVACNTEVTALRLTTARVSATSRLISRGVAQQPEDAETPGPYKPSRTNI